MIIKSIQLSNFRNYEKLDISFDSETNIIYGDNAQGDQGDDQYRADDQKHLPLEAQVGGAEMYAGLCFSIHHLFSFFLIMLNMIHILQDQGHENVHNRRS